MATIIKRWSSRGRREFYASSISLIPGLIFLFSFLYKEWSEWITGLGDIHRGCVPVNDELF